MKTILYILIFNISAISSAQDPLLFETNWFLMELTVDNTNIPIPNNSEINYVTLNLEIDLLETKACNSLGSVLTEFSNDHFKAMQFYKLLYECNNPETIAFEEFYFNDFFNWLESDQTFSYLIELGTNDTRMLTLTNQQGDTAIYGNTPLSIYENTLSQFALFPNPVKNELFLSSKNTTSNLKIKIFNIEGKLLSTQTLANQDQTSIDVSQLLSGLYFLNIEDGNGNTEVKKFIKE